MAQDLLNDLEKKGLPTPFIADANGTVKIASSGEELKKQIAQMTTIIFETISAVGDVKIDTLEIIGEEKGLIMELEEENLVGSLFTSPGEHKIEDLWDRLAELKQNIGAVLERPGVARERPKVKLEATLLDKIKEVVKDYLGDFSERIYKNQMKAQRINTEDFYDDDARRLIFALGKAAGMIIGPSKGRDMTNKLLELLK